MRAFVVAVSAATLFAGTVGAQTVFVISESEFLAPFDAEHPALVSLHQGLAEAEAAAVGARELANPELSASRERPGDIEQLDFTLSWRPPHPGKRHLATTAADASVEAARARLGVDRSSLRTASRAVFARWATASATTERLARWATQLDALARRERERADSGETSGLDARRLALAASEARGQLARAEAERLASAADACAWRPDLPAEVSPQLPQLPISAPGELPEHPRLTALRAELEAARLEEELASRVVDMPTIVGGWQRQDAGGVVAEGPTLGVSWTLPLLDRHRSARAATRARVQGLEAQLELAEREIAATRVGALAAYDELRAAAVAASEAAADAPAVLTAATNAFRAGESGLTDLLDTLRSATDAEVSALALHAEALAAQRRLESLAPVPDPAAATPAEGPPPPTQRDSTTTQQGVSQ
jgi:outer membrane protein TolC